MALELFLVPMEGTGALQDPYRGKYTQHSAVNRSGTLRYSRVESAIVMIDAPQAYLDAVRSQPDAVSLATPANIDQQLNRTQVDAARSIFEGHGIPQQFINVGDSRRQVIRGIAGMFLFSQRMEGRFGAGFRQKAVARGINLDTSWVDFPQALKDEFLAVRDDLGWRNLGLTEQSSLRDILKVVSGQFESTPIFIGGVEI